MKKVEKYQKVQPLKLLNFSVFSLFELFDNFLKKFDFDIIVSTFFNFFQKCKKISFFEKSWKILRDINKYYILYIRKEKEVYKNMYI